MVTVKNTFSKIVNLRIKEDTVRETLTEMEISTGIEMKATTVIKMKIIMNIETTEIFKTDTGIDLK